MLAESIFRNSWLSAGLVMLAIGCLAGCSEQSGSQPVSPPTEQSVSDTVVEPVDKAVVLTAAQTAQWSRNCALCHVRGEGGAPVLGDREAWQSRWSQGEATLLEHTVEGLNNMPPLGYCMDCEEADFLALIRFMGGER